MGDTFPIWNELGRQFTVRVVRYGDRYGLKKCLTHEAGEHNFGPMVEFYDATHVGKPGFDPEGQFVSRYYLSTLEEGQQLFGLDLMGYEPVWKLDSVARAMALRGARCLLDREIATAHRKVVEAVAPLLSAYRTSLDDPGAHVAASVAEIDRAIGLLLGEGQ